VSGHPVVGDPVYIRRVPAVAKTVDQPLRGQLLDFPRQALHAATLGFAHPRTGKPLGFSAEIPLDMADLIRSIDSNMSGT
jgi:23S rRNA pseudouridine1911/1915/1917 synthase